MQRIQEEEVVRYRRRDWSLNRWWKKAIYLSGFVWWGLFLVFLIIGSHSHTVSAKAAMTMQNRLDAAEKTATSYKQLSAICEDKVGYVEKKDWNNAYRLKGKEEQILGEMKDVGSRINGSAMLQ